MDPRWEKTQLSTSQVAARIRLFKKPRGVVKGDIFPKLVTQNCDLLSVPLTHIFNAISTTGSWPSDWKTEFVTPIPKVPLPQTANDLRNISCTMLISKVYDSFVLNWLGSQMGLRDNQFGGVKGSGLEHLLVRLWQDFLQALVDPRAAVLLTLIDFPKAFNRLDFNHYLPTLRDKLRRVTPEPVSNKALTDFPPIFMLAFGWVNSGRAGLKQLRAVRLDISLWGMSLHTAIPPCRFPTSSYILGTGVLEDSRGTRGNVHVGTHRKKPSVASRKHDTTKLLSVASPTGGKTRPYLFFLKTVSVVCCIACASAP